MPYSKAARKKGAAASREKRAKKKQEQIDAIERLHNAGHTTAEIVKELGVSKETVRQAYKTFKPDADTQKRPWSKAAGEKGAAVSRQKRAEKKQERINAIERLHNAGHTTTKIAQVLGVSTETVRRAYKEFKQ